jgi:hypothetical protein
MAADWGTQIEIIVREMRQKRAPQEWLEIDPWGWFEYPFKSVKNSRKDREDSMMGAHR